MSVNYTAAVQTVRMTNTRDHFANGTLEILTAADVLLAVFGLDAAGGTIAGGVWTLVFDADTVAAVEAGVATKAQIKTNGDVADITGLTVGTGGADIILDNDNIASGQNITLTSAEITHA